MRGRPMSDQPVRIDPDTCYTRAALKESVTGPLGVDVDRFLARIKPRKVFRTCWLGSDILEAWRAAEALGTLKDRDSAKSGRKRRARKAKECRPGTVSGFDPRKIGME